MDEGQDSARVPCAVPRSPGRRDAIAQGNVDRRALKGSRPHYRWTAFPLKRQGADDIMTEPLDTGFASPARAASLRSPRSVVPHLW